MYDLTSDSPGQPFKDRTGRLAIMGVVQLCIGGMFALACVAILLASGFLTILLLEIVVVITIFGGLAAWFITMGIGSIRARRWARAMTLVAAWLFLSTGVNSVVNVAFNVPHGNKTAGANGGVPPGSASASYYVMLAVMATVNIAVPAIFVWAYSGRNVKATCAYYNPEPCWTDRRPLPIFTLCLVYSFWIILYPILGATGWAFPFFGVLLTGFQG